MAARAELKKVAMDCSTAVGGRPPTYVLWQVRMKQEHMIVIA